MELRKAAGIASAADFETAVDKLKTDGPRPRLGS